MHYKSIALFSLSLVPASLFGVVTIDFNVGQLQDDAAQTLQDGVLIQILANTAGGTSFVAPTTTGYDESSDIVLLTSFALNSGSSNIGTGGFSYTLANLDLAAYGLSSGDAIMLRWWSDLTYDDYSVGALPTIGQTYGEYRATDWVIPMDGDTATWEFLTVQVGGTLDNSLGIASYAVIPEPSTYALAVGGILALAAIGGLRRKKSKVH